MSFNKYTIPVLYSKGDTVSLVKESAYKLNSINNGFILYIAETNSSSFSQPKYAYGKSFKKRCTIKQNELIRSRALLTEKKAFLYQIPNIDLSNFL